jgi:ribosomal protein S18 acetylase RimI-like enzyme
MQIRTATPEDLKDIQELNKKVMVNNPKFDDDLIPDYFDTPKGEEYVRDALIAKDSCFYIAEEGDQMIGYVNGRAIDVPYRKSKYFEMENLGVIPEYKGKGIGRQLMEKLFEYAKEHGYDRMYLNCYARNEEAIAFYKRNGFDYIDVCMEREL